MVSGHGTGLNRNLAGCQLAARIWYVQGLWPLHVGADDCRGDELVRVGEYPPVWLGADPDERRIIEGHWRYLTGEGFDTPLYGVGIIIFGLVYVYLPFMLFPLAQGIAMVPDDTRQAAYDLGATRWQVLWQIEVPLAAPGIVVGSLLSFVLAAGALAESKILGGQVVIAIADDIETAFTFGQNWPLGSDLSMILIAIIGGLALFGVGKVDLDAIMGRKS